MSKTTTKLERKSFALKLDAPPDDEGRFSGYAAVFGNVDQGNDLIEPGAFTKTLSENPDVPILWAHDPDEPIGVSASMAEDGKGLRVEGQLAMDVQRARELHSLMKIGAIKGLSIGYRTVQRSFKGAVRHLQELKLGEFSLVTFPMNTLAGVDDVKDLYGWEATEGLSCLLCMIRAGADFMVEETREGDTPDAARMQSILTSLSKLLASEVAELAAEAGGDTPLVLDEAMSAHLDLSIKTLQALRDGTEPPAGTRDLEEPPADQLEPDTMSTLRSLQDGIKALGLAA
jgi:HK97 family phage prohead protease